MDKRILIVDDEKEMCVSLQKLFRAHGIESHYCTDGKSGHKELCQNHYDLLISDLRMNGFSGIDLLKCISNKNPPVPTIVISGYATTDVVVQAMRLGATNFYEKPLPFSELLKEVKHILATKQNKSKKPESERIEEDRLITINPKFKHIISMAKKAALTNAPVIVTGESGTGKEILSSIIHYESERKDKPFIKINCAALPEALLESELFGYEKGAFTGAQEMHKGKFEIAEGGTLFFDEISDMSLRTQAKLLRVIQEHEYERLGSNIVRTCDVRYVAATNQDLVEKIKAGEFREDLYFRFSVICLKIPPLRERLGDIIPLTNTFIEEFNLKYEKNITGVHPDVQTIFLSHSWPGNVRELKNCIERSIIFAEGQNISITDLPLQYHPQHPIIEETDPIKDLYDNISREMILNALAQTHGNKTKTAELLKMSRKTLYLRMKKLRIDL
ncbi:MAG: sigma-54 dependent transcriptional regulator [Sphaerochaeta sp.]|nr:sigma-54 dependent transcriptional regulator [Sphaerochaeta sp.]